MIGKAILIGVGSLTLAMATNAQSMGMPQGATADFVTKAAQSDEFERREGRLAETRAHNPAVRKFAAEMVTAHTKTTVGLKAAIRHAHMTPPPPPALSDDQTHMIADLRGTHGAGFDKTYMDQQVKAHQDALGVVQGYAQSSEPGPIHDAAQQTLPIVQHHLDMAKAIQSTL